MDSERAHEKRAYDQEFERRSKVMPFTRFVANGEPLPVEIGNVDKLVAHDKSGTWYMFPTAEALQTSYGGKPEDPTQGQEAQGGPMHANTGRGEKYAGGNVESELTANPNPAAYGKGSQTGAVGIQRHVDGDQAAIGAAVENQNVKPEGDEARSPTGEAATDTRFTDETAAERDGEDPATGEAPAARSTVTTHGFVGGAVETQVSKPAAYAHEPGIIKRSHAGDWRRGATSFEPVARTARPLQGVGGEDLAERTSDGKESGEPAGTENEVDVDDGGEAIVPEAGGGKQADGLPADQMKQGNKTATDTAAEGAVTASHSVTDITEPSPGVEATDGSQKVAPDAGEGTAADIADPTAEGVSDPLDRDGDGKPGGSLPHVGSDAYYEKSEFNDLTIAKLKEHLDGEGVDYSEASVKADYVRLAQDNDDKKAQSADQVTEDDVSTGDLAIQKSDEAKPTTGGGVLGPTDVHDGSGAEPGEGPTPSEDTITG